MRCSQLFSKLKHQATPVNRKIVLISIGLGLIVSLFSAYRAQQYLKIIETQRLHHLKQIVGLARNAIEPILVRYRSDIISRDRAIAESRDFVRHMTYRDGRGQNYIFMSTYKGIMLVQPFEPDKEMTDMWNLRDINGIYIIRELVRAAQSKNHRGFVSYHYKHPGSSLVEEKISYVVGIPELQAYIGTGAYIDDIKSAEREFIASTIIVVILFLALLLILIRFSLREISSQNRMLRLENNERKQAEASLRASEKKYRSVIKNAKEAIFVAQDGKMRYANPETFRLLEAGEADFNDWNFMDFIHPDHREMVIDRHIRRLRGEQLEAEYAFKIITARGREKWIEIKPVLIDWEDKPATLTFLKDITERQKAETALRSIHEELERKVEERTVAFREAKEDAERANQLKSEFLANISHELRNPMHQILSYSKYGIDKIDKPRGKLLHYFNQTRKSAERLMVLINDLLDLSKMESGKVDYNMEMNNVYQIACDIVSELHPAFDEKNLSIEIVDPPVATKIRCDYYKIGQVFRNLLSNAIKFSPTDKSIRVDFQSYGPENGKNAYHALRIDIGDQGVGIPEDEIELVFDKFTQSSTTKTGAGGTGLGLSICREIIRAHRGRIWVENNPDGGATFSFILPYDLKAICGGLSV